MGTAACHCQRTQRHRRGPCTAQIQGSAGAVGAPLCGRYIGVPLRFPTQWAGGGGNQAAGSAAAHSQVPAAVRRERRALANPLGRRALVWPARTRFALPHAPTREPLANGTGLWRLGSMGFQSQLNTPTSHCDAQVMMSLAAPQ